MAVIVVAGVAAYHNSFDVPFLFDDHDAIVANPSIRQLWPPGPVLSPPPGSAGAVGRPLVNLSFAINHALGGTNAFGYHVGNLLLHLTAALLLFGVTRRTLLLPGMREHFGPVALPVATALAAIWTVHPLQTESVVSVVQRNESLAGGFFFATFYAFVRSVASVRSGRWQAAAVAACLLGMACKEYLAVAPVLVLLFDRAFVSGGFVPAWKRHARLYMALAATWIFLGLLMAKSGNRAGTVGFGLGIEWWEYALTQCRAVARYLGLALWPQSLVFDYGRGVVTGFAEVAPAAIILAVVAGGGAFALWRWPRAGFPAAWFFAILAPSSSIVPLTTQTMAEHRMYLPLAGVVALLVSMAAVVLRRRLILIPVGAMSVVALTALTIARNEVYRDGVSIWRDTIAKRPDNARAHHNLGFELMKRDRFEEATGSFEAALRIDPGHAKAAANNARAHAALDRVAEAIPRFEAALRLAPPGARLLEDYAHTLLRAGEPARAVAALEEARRLEPRNADLPMLLGVALARMGRGSEAIARESEAIALQSDHVQAHYHLANFLAASGETAAAIDEYKVALRLAPGWAAAHNNLGLALASAGRNDEAISHYREAVALQPELAEAHANLGNLHFEAGRFAEAVANYERAVQADPSLDGARENLALARRNALLETLRGPR